jgi:acyl phosphate:glycerol-3-phosphate acyltransferase
MFYILIIASYILGSVPTAYIFGKFFKKIDIRDFGSGNVGATNALRVLGIKMGIVTLLIDILKGVAAVLLCKFILPESSDLMMIACGLAAIVGHIFTVFLKFKGGKGVATSAGVFAAICPIPFVITILVFVILVWITKYVSLGSIIGALVLFVSELIINLNNSFAELEKLVFVFIIALFIIIKHKANIKRLIAGSENKISFKKINSD